VGERSVVYRFPVGKPEGKKPLGIPRLRWEANIKMDLLYCALLYNCTT
jgi:hypothetical protein